MATLLSLLGCNKNKYILDGPDMERDVWQEFTLSQSSDVYEGNFAYTVTKESDTYYLSYEYFDYVNKVPDARKIPLKIVTVNELLALNLLSLPDVPTIEISPEDTMILDGTFAKLTITDEDGNTYNKSVSDRMVGDIRSLLSDYVID